MLGLGGAGVLTIALALHVAWIAKRAQARGRSALGWVALGVALGALGLRVGIELFVRADDADSDILMFLFATAPFTLALAPMIAIVLVLDRLPVHVAEPAAWPVFAEREGAGTLVIARDAIELRWPDRTERIARDGLTASADQESVHLTWSGRELTLLPTGAPANRDGRIKQAQTIAARLSS